jgi:hypothetical protein
MTNLERAVFDVITAEIDKIEPDELIFAIRRNALEAPKPGVMVPGSGCRFCLPQHDDDVNRETEAEFKCDVNACLIHSLVSHTLGILQDAELMVDITNVATARDRLTGVLQTIFGKQKAKQIAARLMTTLEATWESPS